MTSEEVRTIPGRGAYVAGATLAASATLLSVGISAVAGWTRGDMPVNSMFWAGLGVLTTAAAHFLGPLARIGHRSLRVLTWAIWAGCMTFVVISHASYFLASQQAHGEQREATVAPPRATVLRPLSKVLMERAALESELPLLSGSACSQDCAAVRRKVAVTKTRIAALDQEANEIRHARDADQAYQAAKDRARRDPALWAASAWLSTPIETLHLLLGLLVGLLLDGVGCISWMLLLTSRTSRADISLHQAAGLRAECATGADTNATDFCSNTSNVLAPGRSARSTGAPSPNNELKFAELIARARHGLDSGNLRNTVRSIRDHLQCGQQTAVEVSRALKATS
jgi:hypothetical protein